MILLGNKDSQSPSVIVTSVVLGATSLTPNVFVGSKDKVSATVSVSSIKLSLIRVTLRHASGVLEVRFCTC